MRRLAKRDDNHDSIVRALRAAGASVQTLHQVGDGCPDLLVGFRGENILVEVKDGSKSASRRALTTDEERWHMLWRGTVVTVTSELEAIGLLGATLGCHSR